MNSTSSQTAETKAASNASNNDGTWGQIKETLIQWQLPNESEIFKIIDVKRKFEKLPEEEETYFKYYRYTFIMEMLSGLSTIPVGIVAYKYRTENRKVVKDIPRINRYLKLVAVLGVPAINLFLVTFYRRYFYKHHFEDRLRLKYMKEIKAFSKKQ